MEVDLVDPQAVKELRTLFKLNPTQAARLGGITPEQLQDLEQGSMTSFETPAQKIQSALYLAKVLSGEQKNGLPRTNVIKNQVMHSHALDEASKSNTQSHGLNKKSRYQYRTNPFQLLLIATIVTFIFFMAAVPAMSIGNPDKLKGDIVVPRTWKVPKEGLHNA